jgi:hypothetical protein
VKYEAAVLPRVASNEAVALPSCGLKPFSSLSARKLSCPPLAHGPQYEHGDHGHAAGGQHASRHHAQAYGGATVGSRRWLDFSVDLELGGWLRGAAALHIDDAVADEGAANPCDQDGNEGQ